MKCWPWSHDWSKWKTAVFDVWRWTHLGTKQEMGTEELQERECQRCGLKQRRPI